MSPSSKRSWIRTSVVLGSALVMLPLAKLTSTSEKLTWLVLGALAFGGVWLFLKRHALRASYFVPLTYIPLIVASRLIFEGDETAASTALILLFVVLFVVGLIVDTFWSPRADDLAELEYVSKE